MEGELSRLRDACKDAELNDDTSKLITFTKLIIQYEKSIASLRIQEGKTLPREEAMKLIDQASAALTAVGRKYVDPEQYDRFVDEVNATVIRFWESR